MHLLDESIMYNRPNYIGPRLKTGGPINSGPSVRPCVRPSVRASVSPSAFYSETAHGIFPKFGMKLGLCKGQKLTRPDFLRKINFFCNFAWSTKSWPKLGTTILCSEMAHEIFLKCCKKLGLCKGQKLTKLDFSKKNHFFCNFGWSTINWRKLGTTKL